MITRRTFLASLPASAAVLGAQSAPKRIGFVDDNLDNFHARVTLEALRGPLKDRGYTLAGATALQHEKSRAWAAKNNVEYFDTPAALDKAVDVYAILAPSTPKTHEELCAAILPFGKTTFVDKTFAPDAATAERIFKMADQHKVALQSSSALRYTAVQKSLNRDDVRHVVVWSPGGSYDEYAVHPVEMAVSCLGPEVQSMMRRGTDAESQLLLNFSGGRTAVVNVYVKHRTPYAASVTTSKETRYVEVDTKPLFVDAATGMLDFFAAGKALVDRRETLAVMRILDASRDPAALQGFIKV
jgi:hypothetical protein